jgi:hypothetical protein
MRTLRFLPLLLILWTVPAGASWARVGTCTTPGTNVGGSTLSATRTASNGNLVVVSGGFYASGGSGQTLSVSDTAGYSFSSILSSSSNNMGISTETYSAQWWAIANGSSDTITITISSSTSNLLLSVCEYSQTGTLSQDGAGATATTGSNTASTLAATQSAAGSAELGVSCFVGRSNSGQTYSPSGSWSQNSITNFGNLLVIDNTSLSSGSNTLTMTPSAADYMSSTMQFFTNAAGSSGGGRLGGKAGIGGKAGTGT